RRGGLPTRWNDALNRCKFPPARGPAGEPALRQPRAARRASIFALTRGFARVSRDAGAGSRPLATRAGIAWHISCVACFSAECAAQTREAQGGVLWGRGR